MTGSTLPALASNSAIFYRPIIRASSFRDYFLLKNILIESGDVPKEYKISCQPPYVGQVSIPAPQDEWVSLFYLFHLLFSSSALLLESCVRWSIFRCVFSD
jgi:hypothetical protein